MKKSYKILIAAAVLVIAAAVGTGIYLGTRKSGNVDETAVARSQEDEGDIHYLDDEAIALAGEAQTTEALNEAAATLALVNAQRANAGLGALTWNENLVQAAMVRAKECESHFSHTRPDGRDWYTVNSQIMYGENLAYLYYNASAAVQAWMDSPTHRQNILGNFNTMGVAVHQTAGGEWYWAQEFGY